MTARHVELRPGTYRDSVRLMQVSQAVRTVPGVRAALVGMATDLNVELAQGMGFAAPPGAGPNDLLVAIAAGDDAGLAAARDRLDAELREPPPVAVADGTVPPRTVGSAVRRSGAGLVLVSTPGRYAVLDALDALDAGASVLLFSDNVPVEAEVRLKDLAAARGLLVMGPDCGTAVIGGVGLGFANVVRPGPVGLVAASGTGAQHVMCLLDAAGVGVSHCLGVGGRDLSAAVAGRSTLAALDALDPDPGRYQLVDFGADELTRGRPHPMIDGSVRLDRLAAQAADPTCGVVLMDVVLGYAADPDPAATLAPAIAAAASVPVVVSLTGTDGDPQGLHRQARALCDAGAAVFRSNARAARYAVGLVRS